MVSQEEQFREIVSQNGILVRRVKLTHRWWRCATGPMLGYDKEAQPGGTDADAPGIGLHLRTTKKGKR